jgi:hypothetical protein
VVAAGCSRCAPATPTPPPSNDGDRITPREDRPPLELAPLPQPPAIDGALGMLPGVPKGPLAVVVGRPTERLRGNERPALSFNKPVVPLGAIDEEMPDPATITPPVKGRWRWIGSSSAEFMPQAPFPYATTFTVTVKPDLEAIDGEQLAAPYSFSFSTLPPQLDATTPQSGWPWLDPRAPLKLVFNQPVQHLEQARLTASGAPVAFTIQKTVDVDEEQARAAGRRPQGRTAWGRPTRYELGLPALAPGAQLRLDLDGVTGVEGPLGVDASTSVSWQVRGAMAIKAVSLCGAYSEHCPTGPLVLQTSNEVDAMTLKGRVHIVRRGGDGNEVAIDAEETWQRPDVDNGIYWVSLAGRLQPGSTYDVVIDAGVADDLGNPAKAFKTSVTTGDIDPWLSISQPFVLLEKSGDGALPVESANLTAVQASITPLSVAQMARVLADDRLFSTTTSTVEATLAIPDHKNTFQRTPLPLRERLPKGQPQLFSVAVRSAQLARDDRGLQQVFGQITDLAAHARLGATSSLVWVTSLTSGQPVEGAVVRVYDAGGAVKGEATTDTDGLARLGGMVDVLGKAEGDSEHSWHVPFALVAATKGDDTGVTLSTWQAGPYGNRAWDGDIPDVDAVVFAERGIYRPGDQVQIKAVVRQRVRGALSVPRFVEGGGSS